MINLIMAILYITILTICILSFILIGRHLAIKYFNTSEDPNTNSITNGAIFGLLGLLIAFTFSSAASKFDQRRQLIIEEANAISTAYMRLDLLNTNDQMQLKPYFQEYVDSRLDVYKRIPDIRAALIAINHTKVVKEILWSKAIVACKNSNISNSCIILLPALNSMFDIANTRVSAVQLHPHSFIFVFLITLAIFSALLAGYSQANRDSGHILHALAYSLIVAITIYVIIDMEYPRLGIIRIDSFDKVLIDTRDSLK